MEEKQQDAWSNFVYEGDPRALAEYLNLGGEIDESVRNALIYLLKYNTIPSQQRGQNHWRDKSVFTAVSLQISISRIGRRLHSLGYSNGSLPKEISLHKALTQYADFHGDCVQTVRARYKRGEKLVQKAREDQE